MILHLTPKNSPAASSLTAPLLEARTLSAQTFALANQSVLLSLLESVGVLLIVSGKAWALEIL